MEDDQIKIARILLNLGHSFLRSVSVENSEEEDGDDIDDNDKENEDKNQQLDGSGKNIEEVLLEPAKNMKYNIEEEVQVNRNMQLEFSKEYDKGFFKLDGKVQGEFHEKNHDNECNLRKRNNINNEYSVKTEIIQKLNTEKYKELFKNELLGNVMKKNEIKRENKQLFGNNYYKVKEPRSDEETGMQVNSDIDFDAKVVQEELKEKQQIPEGKIEIDLNIEMLVNTDLQQDLKRKTQDESGMVKQQIVLDRDIEIELDIEVQVRTNSEQKLGEEVLDEFDKEMQQHVEKTNFKESNKNREIIVDSQHIFDRKVHVKSGFQQELNSKNQNKLEENQQLHKEKLDESGKKIQKNDQKFDNTIQQEKLREKKNMSPDYEQKVFDKNLKNIIHSNKNVHSELNRNDLQQEYSINLQKFKKATQQTSFRAIQQDTEEKTQVESDSEILLELELEAQKKIHEKVVKTFNSEIQQDVERLICDVLNGKQNINEKIQQSLNEEAQAELMKQIQQEIVDLKREIENYEQDNDEELEKELNKEIDKTFSLSVNKNFFGNLILLLDKDSEPIYKRVEKIRKLYFPTKMHQPTNNIQTESDTNIQQKSSEEILHKFDTEVCIDVNSIVPNKLNEETQGEMRKVQKTVNNKIQLEVDRKISLVAEDNTKLASCHKIQEFDKELQNKLDSKLQETIIKGAQISIGKDNHLEFYQKTIESEGEMQINHNKDTQEMVLEHFQQSSNEVDSKDQDTQVNEYFDIVIQFNREIQQNIDGIVEKVAKRSIQVDLSQEIVNMCMEKAQISVDNNIEQLVNKKCEGEVEQILKKVFEEMKQKVEEDEMEVDFDEEVDIKKCTQQHLDTKIHLQIEFYKQMQQEVEGEFRESRIHKDFETDIDTFKKELFNKPKEMHDFEEKTQKESDKNDDEFEKFLKEPVVNINDHKTKKFEKQIQHGEQDSKVEFGEQILEFEKELDEDSDVDIENFEEDIQTEFEGGIKKKCCTHSNINDLKENMQINFEEDIAEEDQKEPEMEIENVEDINEVVEIVDEFEVESFSSVDGFIPTDKENSSADESTNMDEAYSSAEEKEEFNGEQQQLCTEQEKFNQNILDFKGEIHDKNGEIQELYRESQPELEKKNSQEFEDLQLETEIENIQDLDEIPLKLKIQQEQFEEKLHQQFKEFQKEFYTNSKLEYDKEKQFKVDKIFDPVSSKLYDEEQQTFYELKDEFHKIKQEYEDFVQKKIFEDLQQKIDEKQLLEIEKFPEESNDEPNQRIDEDIHKEFIELQRDCFELEPEFKYNVPLEFEETISGQFLEEEPYDLIEKLHSIHRKKLCQFVDSKEWPENCLYPSSLLDALFDDPLEVKPNVFIISLYSIDIGYSIKITMNKDESPIETFFTYAEDTILKYVEREELPPHLLELFDRANPKLFYSGCVIAEIHDNKKNIPGQVSRILLHPSPMSIISDFNQIIAENSHIDWTYALRLKLESQLVLLNNPVLCMDSSPIAGLTVQLQHQLLSGRTIDLNPLKHGHVSSNLKSSKLEMFNDLYPSFKDSIYDNKINSSNLLNKLKSESSKKMVTKSDKTVHHLLWKFDVRVQSFKLMKLYVLVITDTQEYSILLYMNSTVESNLMIRFKINLEKNQLKTYINMILEVLKQTIRSDIHLVRTYKSDNKSAPHSVYVPTLLNENIYEPSHADITQLINTFLEDRFQYIRDKLEFELEIVGSSTMPIKLPNNLQNTDEKKPSSSIKEKVDSTIKENLHYCSIKKLSKNPNKYLETPCTDLSEVELANLLGDSSSLKCPKIPMDILIDLDLLSSPNESSNTTEINSYVEPSLTSPILVVSLDGSPYNIVQEELDQTSEILSTSITAEEILPSSLITEMPSVTSPMIVTSSVLGPITITSSVSSSVTAVSLVSNPSNIEPVSCTTDLLSVSSLTDVFPPVLSPTDLVSSVSSFVTVIPSVSSPITVISSLSSPITLISSVPTVVSSTTSNDMSSEASSIESILASKNMFSLTNNKEIPRLVDLYQDPNINIDTELKTVGMLPTTDQLKYLKGNRDPAINLFDDVALQPPTLYDVMETSSETPFPESLSFHCEEKISVIKHVHDNGICLNRPINIVNNKAMPQIAVLIQKTSPEEQSSNLQLDCWKGAEQFNDILNTDINSLPNLEATISNVPLTSSSLNQCSNQDQVDTDSRFIPSNDSFIACQTLNYMNSFDETISATNNLINEDSIQEINTTISNVDDYRGVKRKYTS